jgi:hypothetical protein
MRVRLRWERGRLDIHVARSVMVPVALSMLAPGTIGPTTDGPARLAKPSAVSRAASASRADADIATLKAMPVGPAVLLAALARMRHPRFGQATIAQLACVFQTVFSKRPSVSEGVHRAPGLSRLPSRCPRETAA